MIPNIDHLKPVELILSVDKDKTAKKGKTCHILLVKQDGAWVKHHHTRKEPNGMPEAKERAGGKLSFDDQEDFLMGVLEEWFMQESPQVAPVAETTAGGADSDDIPF